MRKIIQFRWFILAAWVLLCALSLYFMPDLDQLVREKGDPTIPDRYSSQIANDILKKVEGNATSDTDEFDIIAVFHSKSALSSQQMTEIEAKIQQLETKKKELGITGMLSHLDGEEVAEQLISEDRTTVLLSLRVEKKDRKVSEIRDQLYQELESVPVKSYLTGAALINEDMAQTSQDGIKKTELITVIFIVIVLVLIFRSPITPLISLLTVGISYVVSVGVMANLVDRFDFPFSSFSQIFLVMILFGLGTDYNILLFSRFKEEIAQRKSIVKSIVQTYKTAGKTVFYSGIAVFIGFSGLYLAQFSIFQAASVVAIGISVLFLVLITIVPICMYLLGKTLFWPFTKINSSHKSGLWTRTSTFAVKRPMISLLGVALIIVPLLLIQGKPLSFNSLDEVDNSFSSIQGFQIIAETSSPGKAMPTTVALSSETRLDTPESLAAIDRITGALEQVHGVKEVLGPTRPQGKRIPELYVQDQTGKTEEGLGKAQGGIDSIQEGLEKAVGELSAAPTSDFSKVGDLIEGTQKANQGLSQVNQALKTINNGIKEGADGAKKLQGGITELKNGMTVLNQSTNLLANNYNQLQQGYALFGEKYRALEQQIAGIEQGIQLMQRQISSVEENRPELKEDPAFQSLKGTAANLGTQLGQIKAGLRQLNTQYQQTTTSFAQANQGLKQMNQAQKEMVTGLKELEKGAKALADGLKKGSEGQSQVTTSLSSLQQGMTTIINGQKKLKAGLDSLDHGLSALESGLNKSGKGLGEIGKGLQEARLYLSELSGTDTVDTFYVPEEVRESERFQQALDAYMADDRKAMKWTIILDHDPYSKEAMQTIARIDRTLDRQMQDFTDPKAEVGIGGVSSTNHDLDQIATEDFTRTALIMLIGISLVLILILRSFWNSLFIIGSLILAYYSSLNATQFIFTQWFDYPGLTWTVPFFSFIMIISLGVDYSIFLMMRYREYGQLNPSQAIIEAAGNIGKVVISAAIILIGTFASMYPSGVLTLTQIATVTILGLALMSLLFLPVFMPAVIAIHERLNTPPKGV